MKVSNENHYREEDPDSHAKSCEPETAGKSLRFDNLFCSVKIHRMYCESDIIQQGSVPVLHSACPAQHLSLPVHRHPDPGPGRDSLGSVPLPRSTDMSG